MTRCASISSIRRLRASMLAWSSSSALTVASDAAEVTYALTIANGRLPENMRLISVKQNDVVKLDWRTDKPLSVHLHGYDIEQELKPGAVTEMSFTARATGRFTVGPNSGGTPSGGHAHGYVLFTIEVYP